MSEERTHQGISRRSFLKTSAAAAGVAALGGASTVALAASKDVPTGEEQVFYTTCRGNCMNACELKATVRDGKLVKTGRFDYPYPEYNRLCLKGLSHVEKVYEPMRIHYPMKRASWSPQNPNIDKRGDGTWERISWDDAIKYCADEYMRISKTYGNTSLVHWTMTGSYCSVNTGNMGAYGRMTYLFGFTTMGTATDFNVINGSIQMLGGGSSGAGTNAHADMVNARTMVLWGINPTESQPQSWHHIIEAMDNGCTLISIDTTFNTSASKADIWVNVRPGSDAFLAMAMIRYLISEGKVNEAFMKKSSDAVLLVGPNKKYYRVSDTRELAEGEADDFIVFDEADGELKPLAEASSPALHGSADVDGFKLRTVYDILIERADEYTLERAEVVCQVPKETIIQVADLIYRGPTWIYQGFGVDRYMNAWSAVMAATTLSIITGNLGKPGASAGYSMFIGTEWKDFVQPYYTPYLPDGPAITISVMQMAQVCRDGTWKGQPQPLKGLFIEGSNGLNSVCNRNELMRDVFGTMEFIAIVEMLWTDTCFYSDIVLPCSSWFEEDDVYGNVAAHMFVQICEKAIEPLYESLPDFEICKRLCAAMGKPAFEGIEPLDYLKGAILPLEAQNTFQPVTYELLREKKVIPYCDPHYIHGAGGVFPTPSGRAQIYNEAPAVANYGIPHTNEADDRWPHFEVPYEAWPETVDKYPANKLAAKYPLTYYQEHQRWRVHSTWSHVPLLRELDPEPILKMNPVDAEKRGIKNHDYVRAFNDRGECVLKCIVTNAQRPGQINIPKGWHSDQFIAGHYQALTVQYLNPISDNQGYFDNLVEVEKADISKYPKNDFVPNQERGVN